MIRLFIFAACFTFGSFHLSRSHDNFDINFEHRSAIFIPINAYNNFHGIASMGDRRDAILAKRTSSTPLPRNIADIATSGTVDYEFRVECILTSVEENAKRVLKIKTCAERIPVAVFIRWFFNEMNPVDAVSLHFIQTEKIIFQSMTITSTSVDFKGVGNGEVYAHTQTLLSLSAVELRSLILNIASSPPLTSSTIEFALAGNMNQLGITFSSTQGGSDVVVKMAATGVLMRDYLGIWRVDMSSGAKNSAGFSMQSYESVSMTSPKIHGVYTMDGNFQIVARFAGSQSGETIYLVVNRLVNHLTDVAILDQMPASASVECVTNKYEKNICMGGRPSQTNLVFYWSLRDPVVTLTAGNFELEPPMVTLITFQALYMNYSDIESTKLQALGGTSIYTNTEYTRTPLRAWLFSASDRQISLFASSDYRTVFNGIVSNNVIERGINVVVHTNIRAALTRCDQSSATSNERVPTDAAVKLTFDDSGFKQKLPELAGDLPAMLKCVTPGPVAMPASLFKTFRSPFNLKELVWEKETGKRVLSVIYQREIKVFGPVSIVNPIITVSREGTDDPWTFAGEATIMIGEIEVFCSLTVDTERSFTVIIKIPSMDVDSIAKAFGADPFGNPIIAPFKSLLNIGVQDFYLEAAVEDGDTGTLEMTVSGKPIIFGINYLTLAAFIWNPSDPTFSSSGSSSSSSSGSSSGSNTGGRNEITNVVTQSANKRSFSKGIAVGIILKNLPLEQAMSTLIGRSVTATWFSDVSIVVLLSNAFKNKCTNPANANHADCVEEVAEAKRNETLRQEELERVADENIVVPRSGSAPLAEEEDDEIEPSPTSTITSEKVSAQIDNAALNDTEVAEEELTAEEESDNHFEALEELKDIAIKEGLQIRATFALPTDCKNDGVCEFLTDKVGSGASVILAGEFTAQNIEISAEIRVNIQLGDNAQLRGIKLLIQVGAVDNKVELSCHFKIIEPDLMLKAFIGLSFSGKLEIGASMAGMVYRPLGINWLAIGNLYMAIGITITGLPSLEMGAQIWIGIFTEENGITVATEDVFKFEGYFGLDPSDPTNTYFYARSFGQDITIGNVLKVLGVTAKLPTLIDETGFYGELMFSVNAGTSAKEIEEFGIVVDPGFAFKGKITILGYSIECDTKFDWESGAFYLLALFDPIDDWAGGLITVVRAEDNRVQGPRLLVDIKPAEEVFIVEINGYAHILGIRASVVIEISDTDFFLNITGDLWGVLKAQVKVIASYGDVLPSFSFRGCLQFDLSRIMDAIKNSLKSAQDVANAAFERAERKIEDARQAVQRVKDNVNGWKSDIDDYQRRLERRSAELEAKKRQMQGSCTRECGTVCVPFLGWNKRCFKIWGRWCGCPSWNRCRWRVPNVICIAACEIRRAFAKFAIWAEQIGIKIMLGLAEIGSRLLDGVNFLFTMADGVLVAANSVMSFVNSAVSGLINLGITIATAVASIIQIHQLCVYGGIDPATQACLGMEFDVSIFGNRHEWESEICLDLGIYDKIGGDAAVKEKPEIADLAANVEQIDGKVNTVEADQSTLDREEGRTRASVESETEDDVDLNFRAKRSYVPTRKEQYYYDQAYSPLPKANLRSAETVQAMYEGVPWSRLEEQVAVQRSVIADEANKEKFAKEESHDPCIQRDNVISRYGTITSGFSTVIKAIGDQKESYMREKRSSLAGLKYLNDIFDGGAPRNMTLEETEEASYWKNYAEKHYKQYMDISESALRSKRRQYIQNFRNQFSDVLREKRGLNLESYIGKLHGLAINADKRSTIASPVKEGTDLWNKLKKTLTMLAVDDKVSVREMSKHVNEAQNMLTSYKRSMIPCAA